MNKILLKIIDFILASAVRQEDETIELVDIDNVKRSLIEIHQNPEI